MQLLLTRVSSDSDSTLGILYLDDGRKNKFLCFTLEDEYREEKVMGETRIPEGIYDIKLRTEGGMHQRYTEKFEFHKGMLWLQDVPDFEWIYIHPGVHDDHTDGCILVGDGVWQNVTRAGQLLNPLPAYERVYKQIVDELEAGREVMLQVVDLA